MWWSSRERSGQGQQLADGWCILGPPAGGQGEVRMTTIDVELVRQKVLEVLPDALPWIAAGGAVLVGPCC